MTKHTPAPAGNDGLLRFQMSLLKLAARCQPPDNRDASSCLAASRRLSQLVRKVRYRKIWQLAEENPAA